MMKLMGMSQSGAISSSAPISSSAMPAASVNSFQGRRYSVQG